MLATAHINPHREKVKCSLSILYSQNTLLSTALSHHEAGLCASQINTRPNPQQCQSIDGISGEHKEKRKTIMIKLRKWMTNEKWALSFTCPRFTRMQKCGLFTCQKHHQTMSYSVPLWAQWEVPGPTSPHTISPRACPTPTIVPHSTHTYTQWPLQSQGSHHAIPSHKDTHQSLSRQKGKNDRGGRRKNCIPWEGTEGNEWNTKGVSVCGVGVDILEREIHTVKWASYPGVCLCLSVEFHHLLSEPEVHINKNIRVEKLSATCGILWIRPAQY